MKTISRIFIGREAQMHFFLNWGHVSQWLFDCVVTAVLLYSGLCCTAIVISHEVRLHKTKQKIIGDTLVSVICLFYHTG